MYRKKSGSVCKSKTMSYTVTYNPLAPHPPIIKKEKKKQQESEGLPSKQRLRPLMNKISKIRIV